MSVDLYSIRDARGDTPFMAAVACQAYSAALSILDAIEEISHKPKCAKPTPAAAAATAAAATAAAATPAQSQPRPHASKTKGTTSSNTQSGATEEFSQEVFNRMFYPPGSDPDSSPLYVLCCNDTCSFTWTGTEHINQVGSFILQSSHVHF